MTDQQFEFVEAIGPSCERSFYELFYDAIIFTGLSKDHAETGDDSANPQYVDYEHSFARSAVIHAALALESAANCCLEYLPDTATPKKEADRLPPISKFELFLGLTKKGEKLDRGADPTQKAKALIEIRDGYVHPKVKTGQSKLSPSPNWSYLDFGMYKPLGIPQFFGHWRFDEAVKALKAAANFIDYFFLDRCGFTWEVTTGLLMYPQRGQPGTPYPGVDVWSIPAFPRARQEWKIKLRFLGNEPPPRVKRKRA